MALDPVYLNKTYYSVHSGGGGVDFGTPRKVVKIDTPLAYEAPATAGGGTIGKIHSGIGKGWTPTKNPDGYYVDCQSVASMSYTLPAWPTGVERRIIADGVRGEAQPVVPIMPFAATHRTIGGHDACPSDGPINKGR